MELEAINKALKDAKQELKSNSFAMEMLREQKRQNKRKDITILVILILWFATVIAFVAYLNQFDYSSTTETVSIAASQDGSGTNTVVGGDYEYGANS
jgi:hypothetical protein